MKRNFLISFVIYLNVLNSSPYIYSKLCIFQILFIHLPMDRYLDGFKSQLLKCHSDRQPHMNSLQTWLKFPLVSIARSRLGEGWNSHTVNFFKYCEVSLYNAFTLLLYTCQQCMGIDIIKFVFLLLFCFFFKIAFCQSNE